ncbi:hypothetical protein ACFOZ1_06640 [Gracilibacillus marinus]|uniref:Uncharacterized protein n=1 Tax=Gracilibacillus marinus TaxID=630535 RepID=A0ABV8VTH3_9BACI
MRIGYMVDIIHRFNNIKHYSYNNAEKLESLNRLVSDVEEACEIPVGDPYAMKEFQKNNSFLYEYYQSILEERETALNAI